MLQQILNFLGTIDWAKLITELLSGILPIVLTAVVAWVGKEYAQLKSTSKYAEAFSTMENIATSFITAAYKLGEASGWDGEARRQYVFDRIKFFAAKLPIKFTDAELNDIIDSVIEATYTDLKASNYSPVGAPTTPALSEVAEEIIEDTSLDESD